MSPPEPTPSLPTSAPAHRERDVITAVRNAFILGGSLLATYAVALGIRFVLPRFLGPELIGRYNFADHFAGTFLVLTGLGVDTYIHREISVRPQHASDFFAGITLVRIGTFALMLLAMAAVLMGSGRSFEVHLLVYSFALFHFLFNVNGTLAALLQATTKVAGLSSFNVYTKVVWGLGTLVALWMGGNLLFIVSAQLASEVLKTAAYGYLVRRELSLEWRVDWRAVKQVLIQSFPMFLNGLALAVYGKLGVTLLAFLSSDVEVGYFGQAYALAMLTLMGTPLIFWVMLPLFARAAKRSEDELNGYIRRSLEIILALAFPASLFLGLGADLWVWLFFGPAFAPSVPSMQLLAPVFILTYVAVLCAATLQQLRRAWTVTLISLCSLVASPLFNFILIPLGRERLQGVPGGAALGAAGALLATEALIGGLMLFFIRKRALDGRNVAVIIKSLAICVAVVLVDQQLSSLGHARLAVTVPLYVALALSLGAVRPKDMIALVKDALRTKREGAAP